MSRYARKVDANHGQIKGWLEDFGFVVCDLSRLGGDVPDLLISRALITALVEVKAEKGKMTPGQRRFMDGWKGHYFLARSLDDVTRIDEIMRNEAWLRTQYFTRQQG